VLGILRAWHREAALQLALDRCSGEAALALRSRVRAIETSIQRFRIFKAGQLIPKFGATATALLKLELANQQRLEVEWVAASAGWFVSGCSRGRWTLSGYPSFAWRREAPDLLGPGNLAPHPERPKSFRLELKEGARRSIALVERGAPGTQTNAAAAAGSGTPSEGVSDHVPASNTWKARWVAR
jgi:hypothetical protein